MNNESLLTKDLITILRGSAKFLDQAIIPGFVNMALPSSIFEVASMLQAEANQTIEIVTELRRKNESIQRLLIRLGWPPPLAFSSHHFRHDR